MEGRRKEVMLLILAVVALGVAVWTFKGKSAPPPPTAAETADKEAKAGTGKKSEQGAKTALSADAAAQGSIAPGEAQAGQQRNPFATPGAATEGSVAAVPPNAATTPVAGATLTPNQPGMVTPPLPEGTEAPKLALTGVVDGKPTVAILRQDDKRFFVKVGDQVGDGYRVQSIRGEQVVLVGKQGKLVLRMGGRQ